MSNIGVYVDISNISQNGGFKMRYEVLREFACRNNGIAIHLNAYIAYDVEKAEEDYVYKANSKNFHSILRDFGYKVIIKKTKWYTDEDGNRYGKSNADLDMAVDILLQSEKLDKVLIVTGDGDFVQVVRSLQNKGVRVEILAFKNISNELIREADSFINGYLIPELIPTQDKNVHRGVCYSYKKDENFGFIRFIREVATGDFWVTDTRKKNSPYESVFFHMNDLPKDISHHQLPSREQIFEFEVEKNRNDNRKLIAINIKKIDC